jgi:Asp-tRNA(Asn)/Glu-tRNA(Gln) amidotransferase B subunit
MGNISQRSRKRAEKEFDIYFNTLNKKNMKKQTAVEWLINNLDVDLVDSQWVIQQAKEMEKQLIIDAHHSASIEQGALSYDLAKDYYNQTFAK